MDNYYDNISTLGMKKSFNTIHIIQGQILRISENIKYSKHGTPYIWFSITDYSKTSNLQTNVITVFCWNDQAIKYHKQLRKNQIYDIINPYIEKINSHKYRLQIKQSTFLQIKKHLNYSKRKKLCIIQKTNKRDTKKIFYSKKKTHQISIKNYFH